MRLGRDEAIDLIGKWLAEETEMLCSFGLRTVRGSFKGRLALASTDGFTVASADRFSEISLRFGPSMIFTYGESRGLPDAAEFIGGLVIFFRLGEEGEEDDFISLTEMVA
jgi:hypothetical protein